MGRRLILDTTCSSPTSAARSTGRRWMLTSWLSRLCLSLNTGWGSNSLTVRSAADRARALAVITSAVEVLEYTEATAACHARLIAHVRRAGMPRGAHDLIIAAHALQTERIVLTFDAKARFGDLPGVSATDA